jgi:transposase
MQARDFRSLGWPAQEALRRWALFLIAEEGMSQAQAAQAVGVHRQTVNIWLRRYRERGEDGVLDGRRVSPRLGKGLLTEDEAQQARDWITGTTPEQQGLPWALWTRRAVREVIERRLGKRLGLTTVQLHLQPTPAGLPAGDPGTLGDEPAKAAGAGQAALARSDPEVAGVGLSGHRQARQVPAGHDLLG